MGAIEARSVISVLRTAETGKKLIPDWGSGEQEAVNRNHQLDSEGEVAALMLGLLEYGSGHGMMAVLNVLDKALSNIKANTVILIPDKFSRSRTSSF